MRPASSARACFEQTQFHHRAVLHALRRAVRDGGARRARAASARPAVADPPPWGAGAGGAALRRRRPSGIILPFKYGDRVENGAGAGADDGPRRGGAAARGGLGWCRCRCTAGACCRARYNQAALLARALARLDGPAGAAGRAAPDPRDRAAGRDVAGPARPRRWQARSPSGRRGCTMLRGCPGAADRRRADLGATARACTAALLAAGAARVDVLAAARVRSQQWDG